MRRVVLIVVLTAVFLPAGAGAQVPFTLDALNNDSCANALPMTGGRVYQGNTLLATDQFGSTGGRGAGSPDVVFRFTVPERRLVTFRFQPQQEPTFYSVFYIRTVCDDPSTQVSQTEHGRSINNPFRIELGAGDYYLIMDGDAALPVDRGWYRFQFSMEPPPPGNSCAHPRTLDLGDNWQIHDNTYWNTDELRSPKVPSGGRDVVFRLDLASTKTVTIDSFLSAFDTSLYVRTVCTNAATDIAWSDRSHDGHYTHFKGRIENLTLQPGTYYVVLDGWTPSEFGQYDLRLTES